MFCPTCGAPCNEGDKACPYCGYTFENAQTAPAEPVIVVEETAPVAPKKPNNTVLILGIVSVLINAGLGCTCACLGSLPGIACAIIGLILANKEKKENPGVENKNTKIGTILCYVALALAVINTIINAIAGGMSAITG